MKRLSSRLVLVSLVTLAPLLALQAYYAWEVQHDRRDQIEREAIRLVQTLVDQQQRIIDGAGQKLTVLASTPAVQDNMPSACHRLMRNLLKEAPRYLAAAVADREGRVRCASYSEHPDSNVSDLGFFKGAIASDGPFMAEYTVSRVTGLASVHVARAFRDTTGARAGVVFLALRIDWLGRQLDAFALPPNTVAVVADRNGTLLARTPSKRGAVGASIPAEYRFTLEGDSVRAVESSSHVTGRPIIMAYSPPGAMPAGWLVAVDLDKNAMFADLARANLRSLLMGLLVVALSLACTALASAALIRRPFVRLLAVADRWRGGDLPARTGIANDGSEFGRLAAAFDAMAAAREATERAHRSALEGTTDSVIVVGEDGRIAYANQRALAQVAPGRAIVGVRFADLFAEPDGAVFARAMEAAAAAHGPARVSGSYPPLGCTFDVHACPSDDGLSLFFRDVTEERRIVNALRESEEQYRTTFEQTDVGMSQATLDGHWLRVNDAFCAITGYSREELIGRSFVDITHPDDLAASMAAVQETRATGRRRSALEKRYIRKDGSVVWVGVSASVVRDAQGRPSRVIGITRDITVRKSIQDALEASEARLQLAREAAGFGVWDWGLPERTILWSDQLWRLRGLDPRPGESVSQETWIAGLHPDDRDRVTAEVACALAGPSVSHDTAYRIVRPDGAVRWLAIKARILRDQAGTARRMVGLAMDITETRETEAELRRLTNDLEERVEEEIGKREAAQARASHAERMQALGQLAAGIAHDFNNVLQMVMGASSLIEARPDDAAEVQNLARLVGEAADQGAATTRRLLSLGRRGDLRSEPVDVPELLDGLREILSHTLGAGVAVGVRIGPDLVPVQADRAQLETSLVNLAINARDAMPDGGSLTFQADMETVGDRGSGPDRARFVHLTVRDTGCGMDEATLARVGEPFFTTKKAGIGNGLGVAMVKGFAEQSGGGMRIESVPGKGTTITMWLPTADGAARASKPSGIERSGLVAGAARASVLLVDDEAVVRKVIARHLQRGGFDVASAANGAEALRRVDDGEAVDILVTDLSMPGMDGVAVISAVQARRPGVPAVLLTGYASDGVNLAISGAVSGSYSLLRKPVSGAQLLDRVRSLLAGRAGTGPRGG